MEIKGEISSMYRDMATGRNLLMIATDSDTQAARQLINRPLRISMKQWREKRSLDANAYYWVLVGKLAAALNTSSTEMHNQILSRYGQPEIAGQSLLNIILLDSIEWARLEYIHLKPTSATQTLADGKLYRVYRVMRGSSTYDTKEMSVLIDGVVEEAREQGIETLPPDELEHMKQMWRKKNG